MSNYNGCVEWRPPIAVTATKNVFWLPICEDSAFPVSLFVMPPMCDGLKKSCQNIPGVAAEQYFANQQEKDAKASLQAQIQSLREDNQRLLEESYSASTKLKKFTEWVFNTIDMN